MSGDGEQASKATKKKRRSLDDFPNRSGAEDQLLLECALGQVAKFAETRPTAPARDNVIRSEFLRFLALGGGDDAFVHEHGVWLQGAWIEGDIDLRGCRAVGRIHLHCCVVAGKLILAGAETTSINLEGTRVDAIMANGLICKGGLYLWKKFLCLFDASFIGAQISTELNCEEAQFGNSKGVALNCNGLNAGKVSLKTGFLATGEVSLITARISGDLDCQGGSFQCAPKEDGNDSRALNCDGARIDGRVFMRLGFMATGEVRFVGCTIGGDVECNGGTFSNPTRPALRILRAKLGGSLWLCQGFKAEGEVILHSSSINGELDCGNGLFDFGSSDPKKNEQDEPDEPEQSEASGSRRIALNCDGIEVKTMVLLRYGFRAVGEVRFVGAKIGRIFDCQDGSFDNEGGTALICGHSEIGSTFVFRDLRLIRGNVRLHALRVATLEDDVPSWLKASALHLDGLRYDRFGHQGLDYQSRIAWLKHQRADHLWEEFRPQPWQQAAHVLQQMGHEEDAKELRMKMRALWRRSQWGSRKHWWQRLITLIRTRMNWILGVVVGYGYRPWRALGGFIVLWLAGVLVFGYASSEGLIGPREPDIFLTAKVPDECRGSILRFDVPQTPSTQAIAATKDPSLRALLEERLGRDIRRRDELAEQLKFDTFGTPTWSAICDRSLPAKFTRFNPWLYSLDVVVPLLDLRQKSSWEPHVRDEEGEVIDILFTLPALPNLFARPWDRPPDRFVVGNGYLIVAWQWFETLAGVMLAVLLAGSVSGLIRKD